MRLTNTSAGPIVVSLYSYADVDVSATANFDSAVQTGPGIIRISDTANFVEFEGPGAQMFQVTSFSALRALLTNSGVNTLNNMGLPFNAGDWTGGYQWDVALAGGASSSIRVLFRINQAGVSGACCTSGTQCGVMGRLECEQLGGSYQGDNTACTPNPCMGEARGACCINRCVCITTTSGDCLLAAGTYLGDAVECVASGCFPVPACPCDWNADDRLNSQDFFDFLTAFFGPGADYNCDSLTNSQDFFDFLECFFGPPQGCL
jgi:hypothetical protein